MLKFYILKRDEWEDKDSHAIIQFETVADLEAYLSYNRAYIKEMKTVADDVPNRFANIV
jgi:hypothetical protein